MYQALKLIEPLERTLHRVFACRSLASCAFMSHRVWPNVSHRAHAHSALTVKMEDVNHIPHSIVIFWKEGTMT